MTVDFVIALGREAMETTAVVSAPVLGTGLIVGVLISIFQTVTSIQEMSLTFVPKIIAVFLGLLFAAPWMLDEITSFTIRIFENIPMYIR